MGGGLSSTFEIPEVCQVERPTPTQLTLCSLYEKVPIAMMCLGIFHKKQTNITIFLQRGTHVLGENMVLKDRI